MKVVTRDRGEIIHLAGLHGLSPALGERGPLLSGEHESGAVRCGWEEFFRAVEGRELAVVAEGEEQPGPPRFVPATQVDAERGAHRGLSGAVAHARRFVWALLGQAAAG